MGATIGYFILLCALSLGVEGYDDSSPFPISEYIPKATDAMTRTTPTYAPERPSAHLTDHPLTHWEAVSVTPASKHPKMTISHLITAATQPETPAAISLPTHPSTFKRTDVNTTPAPKPKPKTAATLHVLTQTKEPETQSVLRVTDELSKPKIYYQDVHYKSLEISCFSEHGRLPITYSIIKNKTEVLKSLTVHSREPAHFTIEMKPGKSAEHVCKAESGRQSRFSEPLLEIKIPEEEATPTHSDADKEEDISEPKHLITLSHILTSVDRSVQHRNIILMSVCGPVILLVLAMFIIVVHIRQRRDNFDKP